MPAPSGGFNRFPAIIRQMEITLDQVVRVATMNIEARAKASMEGVKGGRVYRVPGVMGSIMHRASAPGEAPAIQFGTLYNSIQSIFPSKGQGYVYTTDEKAPYLEFSTRRMAARPFMTPAALDEAAPYAAAMKALLGRLR